MDGWHLHQCHFVRARARAPPQPLKRCIDDDDLCEAMALVGITEIAVRIRVGEC